MSLIFDDQPNITWWDDVKIWPTNCSVKNQFGQWDKTLTFLGKNQGNKETGSDDIPED